MAMSPRNARFARTALFSILVLAVVSCGSDDPTTPAGGVVTAPTGVVASPGDRQNVVRFNSVAGATTYNLYFRIGTGATTADTKIADVTSPFTHVDLTGEETISYVVTAENSAGESPASATVSATPFVVFAYDGFDLAPSAAALDGSDGGFGWAGPWESVGGVTSNILDGSLVPRGDSASLLTAGNAVNSNDSSRDGRFLDVSPTGTLAEYGYLDGNGDVGADGKTLYVSFLQRASEVGLFWEFEFKRDALGDEGRIAGIGNDTIGGNANLRAPNSVFTTIGPADTEVNFWVVRIDFQDGNDDIRVYRDPQLGAEPTSADLEALAQADMSFDGISFGSFVGPTVDHDEVRIGSTFLAVTPQGALPERMQVVDTTPASSATEVDVSTEISVTFDRPIDASTALSPSFIVRAGASAVSGDLVVSGATVRFEPTETLSGETLYNVQVSTGLAGLDGATLAEAFEFQFETSAAIGPEDGLVAYWNFDAGFGATVGGLGFTGIPTPGVDIDSDGRFGSAARFERANAEYLVVENSPVIQQDADHSYSAWYRLDEELVSGRYFVLESTPDYPISYGLRNDGAGPIGQVFTVTDGGPNFAADVPGGATTAWHNIIVTYDVSEGRHEIYLDGEFVDSIETDLPLGFTTGLVIGAHRGLTGRNFDGRIDDVAVWNRVLSASDIEVLQTAPATPGGSVDLLTVTAVNPADGATGVGNGITIEVTFDRELLEGYATQRTVKLLDGAGAEVNGFPSTSGNTLTFDPTVPLLGGTTYTLRLEPSISGTDGSVLGLPYESSFTTVAELSVVSVSPSPDAVGVEIDEPIVVEFSSPIDASSVTANTFRVEPDGWIDNVRYEQGLGLPGTWQVEGNTITWTPQRGRLGEFLVDYEVKIDGVTSTSGATLEQVYTSGFQTVMLDFYYSYRLRTESTGAAASMEVDSGGSAFMNTSSTGRGEWHFLTFGGQTSSTGETVYFMANDQDGDGSYLDAGNGSAPARMESSSVGVTSRQFYFVDNNTNPGNELPGESGRLYNIRTIDQGASRVLGEALNAAQTGFDLKMLTGSTSNNQRLWYFANVGRRFGN